MIIKYLDYRIILSLVITIVFVYCLLVQIDYRNIFYLFRDINYLCIILSFLFYFILTFIRALRIKLLINKNLNIKILFAIVLINNSIISLLPFRTGELSLPLLLKKYVGVEKKEGFLLLFYLRIIDTIIVLTFFVIVVLLFSEDIIKLSGFSYGPILLLFSFLLLALFKIDKIILTAGKFIKKRNYHGPLSCITSSADKLSLVCKFYKRKIKEVSMLSILIFLILIFVLGFVLKAYPIDLSYVDVILVSLIIIIIMSLPINGIAGVGTIEMGISSSLILLGVNKDLSVSVAFNYHFIYLMFIIFFGSLSYLYLRQRSDQQ